MPLVGHNILLEGGSGTGKTYSLRTLVAAGIEVRSIFLEPRWKSVEDVSCSDGFHINYVNPTTTSFDALATQAQQVTRLPWDAAAKWADSSKAKYDGFVRILGALNNYKCIRCNKDFGDATSWSKDVCLWFDGLSGLNMAAMQMIKGGALTQSQPQWGAAQSSELQLIRQCVYGCNSWFVLVAHLDKLMDEINGGFIIQPKALGRALGPELPKDFDEVVLAEKVGTNFKWSTAASGADLKSTYLPLSDNIRPDFGPIVTRWNQDPSEKSD